MLLINAVNTEGHPLEIYIRDGKIAAVGQDLSALAGEGETLSLIHISEPTRLGMLSRMPSSA